MATIAVKICDNCREPIPTNNYCIDPIKKTWLCYMCFECQQNGSRKIGDLGKIVRVEGCLGGKPVFKGTRLDVKTIMSMVKSQGLESTLNDYPRFRVEDYEAANRKRFRVKFYRFFPIRLWQKLFQRY